MKRPRSKPTLQIKFMMTLAIIMVLAASILLRPFGLVAFLAGLTEKILAHTLQDIASICRYSFSLVRRSAWCLWIRTNVS
jgi:hypothetical protein